MNEEYTYCPDCGAELPETDWPRSCAECGETQFLNPIPVSVLLQPVDGGLLTVRRAIEPHAGDLAFPGGYLESGETWREAAVRELREETAIDADPEAVEVFDVISAPDGTLLVFGRAPERDRTILETFEPTSEVSELVVVRHHRDLAFPLHTRVLDEWLEQQ